MRTMKTMLAIAVAVCAVLSAEGFGHKKAVKAGAAIAAIGAGALSQIAPAVVAAGLWAPPQHHGHGGGHGTTHGWESHGHGWEGHGHGGGYGNANDKVGHGHGHGYNEFGWASLPSPVVNIGPLLRHSALPPIHELLPRINVALPRVYGLHGHGNGYGWSSSEYNSIDCVSQMELFNGLRLSGLNNFHETSDIFDGTTSRAKLHEPARGITQETVNQVLRS
ncbi:hypothetical protein BIW11_08444, partial [Tropilaelaps mercedesae]